MLTRNSRQAALRSAFRNAQARHGSLTRASIPITGVLKSRLRIGHVA